MLTRRSAFCLFGAAFPRVALAEPAPGAPARLPPDQQWLTLLASSLPEEQDYSAEIVGTLPPALCGTLFRNGPGLFERDDFRKWTILDGDGMIRATTFESGKARFRTRFVRTEKFNREDRAGAYLFPTWTTPAPDFFANVPCIPSHSQAGITALVKNGALYAFDEVGAPWALDPETLETRGEARIFDGALESGPTAFKAHTKTDARSGHWVLVGARGRLDTQLHIIVRDSAGTQIRHVAFPSPRGAAYFHDFFWADPYVVFYLQPALLSPLPMLAGLQPYAESLHWRPQEGSLLYVVDTSGTRAPVTLEAPPAWMWHALNAYRHGNVITADFIGYDSPKHFLGQSAAFRAIMTGEQGVTSPGTLRRLRIDLDARRARQEIISAGDYEFPTLPLSRVGRQHRYGYMAAQAADQGWFHDGLARVDTTCGRLAAHHFGAGYYVGEPVFIPDPGRPIDPESSGDPGWLIAEVLDGKAGRSALAIFNAERIEDGPVAEVRLQQALPFSFHGWWQAA